MADLKKMTAIAAGGAALTLAGVIGVGAGLAGAAPVGDPLQHSTGDVQPNAIPIIPGTYEWYVDGTPDGTITISSGNTFTSTLAGDSGTWAQASNTFGLTITGGGDAGGGCVFAGHVNDTGMNVSTAAKPGHWTCTGYGTSGTFYIAQAPAAPSAAQARGDALAHSGVLPMTSAKVLPGTYKWTEDGYYSGKMSIASGNTYTSTLSGNDSGSYVQDGSAFAFNISGGVDSGIGCLEVGKVNKTGTAVNPGNWACPGTGTSGYFVLVKKS